MLSHVTHVENLFNNPEPVEVARAWSTDMSNLEHIDGTCVPSLQAEVYQQF